MRKINLDTWARRDHFNVFNTWDYPHFNMCANVDITAFVPYVRQHKISFTVAAMFVIARAANAIPEFRCRIRSGEVVEHEIVNPSTTILTTHDLFTFCTVEFTPDFSVFAARAQEQIAYVKRHSTLKNDRGRDDMLYMTAIPWVSFTSFMHPIHLHPVDSVPRFAWGKFFKAGDFTQMPLGVQAHHALMDGIHMGRFYAEIQGYLHQPEAVLGVE